MPAVNVSVTFDAPLKQISEPGFGKELTSKQLSTFGKALEDGSEKTLWVDPRTQTVMLRPRQLDASWLDSTNQVPWIIRLAQMDVNATDLASGGISEHPAFGNTSSPWIYHNATIDSGFFPAALPPFPEAGPLLVGTTPGIDATKLDVLTVRANRGFMLPVTVPAPPPAGPPVPSQTVDTTTGRFLCQTQQPLLANQPLFLRWLHASTALGFPPVYRFYIGQFAIDIKESFVQVYQDASQSGDRSFFRHVATLNLYSHSPAGLDEASIANNFQPVNSQDGSPTPQYRWLLWLPFRHNQVLLYANTGRSKIIQTRPVPKRLPDNSDWDIVRSDKLVVWFLVPHWGRFQIQRVAYSSVPATANFPPIVLDFTPAAPPGNTLFADTDHGTTLSIINSSPPSYTLPINNADDCPAIPPGINSLQARQYGRQAIFGSSANVVNSDAAWTPFFYRLRVSRDPVLVNPTTTPTVVNDVTASTPAGATVLSCEFSAGIKPGEGKATIHVADFGPYALNNLYYRCGNPIQIKAGGVAAWTGYTLPPGIEPTKKQSTHPRRIIFTAADRWWQLTKTYLRDNRDWTGIGHISVVQTIMQEAGIDTAGMDNPPISASTNQPLGLVGPNDLSGVELDGRTNGPYQPRPGETAASFIQRLAKTFSGWDIGFQADGTPFYHPRYFYTTPEIVFYENQAAATTAGEVNPKFYRRLTFSTIEPEANAILVVGNSKNGTGRIYSSLFVDFASITNPLVANYMGRYRSEVVEIMGSYSCAGINYAARTIFQQTRRRHIMCRFECDYDPLVKVGHCLTLSGYGNYRVMSMTARFDKQTWHHCIVEGEFIELGYGLPTGAPT